MSYSTAAGRAVQLGPSIAKSGAQGEVFRLIEPKDQVCKLFHPSVLAADPSLQDRIETMVGARPDGSVDPSTGHIVLAWPTDLVRDGLDFVGFTMPMIDTNTTVEFHDITNPSSRNVATGTSTWSRGFTWQYLARTAENLASVADRLHHAGVVIGDFNARNILVSQDARVTLIDCDSMQIEDATTGRRFLCGLTFVEFTAPELLHTNLLTRVRAPSSDLFALAVHVHQLLLGGSHPFDGLWLGGGEKPKRQVLAQDGVWVGGSDSRLRRGPSAVGMEILPSRFHDLFDRAFTKGAADPEARPSAREWRDALHELQQHLRECQSNRAHVFHQACKECPWCRQLRQRTAAAPSPSPRQQVPLPPPRQVVPTARVTPAAQPVAKPVVPVAAAVRPAPPHRGMRLRWPGGDGLVAAVVGWFLGCVVIYLVSAVVAKAAHIGVHPLRSWEITYLVAMYVASAAVALGIVFVER